MMKQVRFTLHVTQRMIERGVTEDEVCTVIGNHHTILPGEDGTIKLFGDVDGRTIGVYCKDMGDHWRVITAFAR